MLLDVSHFSSNDKVLTSSFLDEHASPCPCSYKINGARKIKIEESFKQLVTQVTDRQRFTLLELLTEYKILMYKIDLPFFQDIHPGL